MIKNFLILIVSLVFSYIPARGATLSPEVSEFVNRYCMECHDADTEKGDRNFEPFLKNPSDKRQHMILEEILDSLNLGEMPPQKKKTKQPPLEERRKIISIITDC